MWNIEKSPPVPCICMGDMTHSMTWHDSCMTVRLTCGGGVGEGGGWVL
jgi:hypothetical protein